MPYLQVTTLRSAPTLTLTTGVRLCPRSARCLSAAHLQMRSALMQPYRHRFNRFKHTVKMSNHSKSTNYFQLLPKPQSNQLKSSKVYVIIRPVLKMQTWPVQWPFKSSTSFFLLVLIVALLLSRSLCRLAVANLIGNKCLSACITTGSTGKVLKQLELARFPSAQLQVSV